MQLPRVKQPNQRLLDVMVILYHSVHSISNQLKCFHMQFRNNSNVSSFNTPQATQIKAEIIGKQNFTNTFSQRKNFRK